MRILVEEFETAHARGTSDWNRKGRILKIILYGSYARGDWVDDPVGGYHSDYDILVVVNNERLNAVAEFRWFPAFIRRQIFRSGSLMALYRSQMFIGACVNMHVYSTNGLRRLASEAKVRGRIRYAEPCVNHLQTTANLRAVQILLGHTKIEDTVRIAGRRR